jgi:DNA replication protein DnaC
MYSRRREDIYGKIPRVAAIDELLRRSIADAVKAALTSGEDTEAAIRDIAEENLALQEERGTLIAALGYPPDYIDDKPLCAICGDSGYVDGKMCSCLMERYKSAQAAELSSLLKLGQETFDSFNLDYYDDTRSDGSISPRQNMELIYEASLQYARKFGPKSGSLFFTGGTGLGKTFLSSCIAKVVSERGFSVVYDTAVSIFAKFEEDKFSGGEVSHEAVERYLGCDLLIMDDLGTEMTTSFTTSALYNIINTRLCSGRQTIISSNLSFGEMSKRYTPQIMSRLQGEYDVFTFYGRDIRLVKKGL